MGSDEGWSCMPRVLHFLLYLEQQRPVLAILPTGAEWNRWKITVKVVFACTCTWSP
jgi:hypothetical protein